MEITCEIGASPELVFFVLTDFSNYTLWNPFQTKIEGRPEQGARLHVRLQYPGGGTIPSALLPEKCEQKIDIVQKPYLMQWSDVGGYNQLTKITRRFELSESSGPASGTVRTSYRTRLQFEGPLARIMSSLSDNIRRGLQAETEALREQCELLAKHCENEISS